MVRILAATEKDTVYTVKVNHRQAQLRHYQGGYSLDQWCLMVEMSFYFPRPYTLPVSAGQICIRTSVILPDYDDRNDPGLPFQESQHETTLLQHTLTMNY